MGTMSVAANNMHAADIMRVEWTAELRHQTVKTMIYFAANYSCQRLRLNIDHAKRSR